jgi:hypothetical protein
MIVCVRERESELERERERKRVYLWVDGWLWFLELGSEADTLEANSILIYFVPQARLL